MKTVQIFSIGLFPLLLVVLGFATATALGLTVWLQTSTSANSGDSSPLLISSADYKTATSIEEITQAADIILIGNIEGVGGVHNQNRLPTDHTKPYPYVYSVGREYHVVVDQYLKGEGPTKAVISQFEGIFEVAEAEPAIRDNPAIRKPDPNIVAMALNQTYLFFLRSPESNPRVLVPAIEPYRFKFTDGQAFPEGTFSV